MALSRSSEMIELYRAIVRGQVEHWPPIANRMITLLAPDDAFPELLIDPLTLAPHQRLYDDPTMTAAMKALIAIFGAVHFPQNHPALAAQLRETAVQYIRRWWSTLVRWLDFIQPKQRCVIFSYEFAKVLMIAYDPLTRYKASFLDLMEQTPQVVSLLFDLWLHLPMYSQTFDRLSDKATRVFGEIFKAVMSLVSDDNQQSRSWITEALLVTRMRPRRLYRQVVENIRLCRDAEGALVANACRDHFRAMASFVRNALTIPRHSRDTIRILVELLGELEARSSTDEESEEAVLEACNLLFQIWYTSEDDRSLLRALRLGVLPKMVSLNVQTEGVLINILAYVFKRSIFFPVARLLGDMHPAPLFQFARMDSMVDGAKLDQEYTGRYMLARTLAHITMCGNGNLECRHTDRQVRMKICPCSTVKYCSRACQRAHWSRHRPKCREYAFRSLPGSAWLKRIEIQFAAIFSVDFLQRVGSDVMAEIDADIAAHADSPAKRVYWVHVRYHHVNGIQPSYKVLSAPSRCSTDIDASQWGVAIFATLGDIRGDSAIIHNGLDTVAGFRALLGHEV
ncbi:hypothetical protein EV122DRAFT_202457 [Schizophyllum commune]